MKLCTVCKGVKSDDQFYGHKGRSQARGPCKVCWSAQAAKRYLKNPTKFKERAKVWTSKNVERTRYIRKRAKLSRYGLTIEDYDAVFIAQKGKCRICCKSISKDSFETCVDHNHNTHEVRGILCRRCNRALGFFDDDACIVEAAAEYLRLNGAFNLETEKEIAKCLRQV